MATVGLLALQGAFREHKRALEALGRLVVEVRRPEQLDEVDALVIPGGESTTISKLMDEWDMREPLLNAVKQGMPMLGTCAGAILLSSGTSDPRVRPLGLLDIRVDRNAFGRQVDSFETDLDIRCLGAGRFPGVFIRAPRITGIGDMVEVLSSITLRGRSEAVAVKQGNVIATTFHPELTKDLRLHRYFMDVVAEYRERRLKLKQVAG